MKKIALNLFLMTLIILFSSHAFAELAFDYEPNNSPDSAYVINNDSEILSTISNSSDIDYYQFFINGPIDTVINLTSPQGMDYDIKLFDENYKEIAGSELPAENVDTINKNSLPTGTYFIKVYSFKKKYSDVPYKLSFKINDFYGENKTGYSGIPEADMKNTTMANALEINSDIVFRAKVNRLNENRYYKFKVNNVFDVDILMTPPKGVDLDIRLYNSKGLEAGSSTNKDGIEKILKKRLLPDTYYLKVYGHNFAFSSETFEVSLKSVKVVSGTGKAGEGTGNSSVIKESALKKPQAAGGTPRALLLYVGPELPAFSDEDIKKMLIDDPINTKEFIISDNGAQFNTYIDSSGDLIDIVTPEEINALTKDKIDSTGKLESIKEDYTKLYNRISKSNSLDYFSNEVVDLALRLIKTDPDVKLSIAIPGTEFHSMIEEFIEPVKEILIKGIKERLDTENPDYWEKNIRGFYFSTECIPYYYTWFKPDKAIDFNNPIVKTMVSLSNEIHQVYNKEFMWIPYYGTTLNMKEFYNKDQFVRIGYIANRTNLFDYIIIQPTYYFKSSSKNIPYVQSSSKSNMVLDVNDDIVGGIKSSKTLIGAEMEIDSNYNTVIGKEDVSKAYQERYSDYVKAFSAVKKETPVAFYAGSRDELFVDAVYNAVKSFFGNVK
jgi:hypothetical protein